MEDNNQYEIMEKFKVGDSEAFKKIFELYSRPLYFFVRKLIQDDTEAEDIVSETFRKIWQRKEHIETLANVKAFLFITARNSGIDFLRYSKKQRISRQEFSQTNEVTEEAIINKIVETEILEHAYQKLQKLPEKIQTIFRLHFSEGVSLKEIAERLGMTQEDIRITKFRTLQRLRKSIVKDKLLYALVTLSFYSGHIMNLYFI